MVHRAKTAKKNHGVIGSQPRIPTASGAPSASTGQTDILLREILGELRGMREEAVAARDRSESAELNLYARNDMLLNRVEALAVGLSTAGKEISDGGLSAGSIAVAGRELSNQILGIMDRGDKELDDFMALAKKGRKRPGTLDTVAPRKRNKTVYGPPVEDDEEGGGGGEEADSGTEWTRDEIDAAAAADPPPPVANRRRRGLAGLRKTKKTKPAGPGPK